MKGSTHFRFFPTRKQLYSKNSLNVPATIMSSKAMKQHRIKTEANMEKKSQKRQTYRRILETAKLL